MQTLSAWWQQKTTATLLSGGVIAYPTEAVWGLGCDPQNPEALQRLLQLKQRKVEAGVLLVASSMEQLRPYLAELPEPLEQQLKANWPGPVNWVLPASDYCPFWIQGAHEGVGVRVSAHPVVRAVCDAFGGPIVSTSANKRGRWPVKHRWQLGRALNGQVDLVVPGDTGGRDKPCEIRSGLRRGSNGHSSGHSEGGSGSYSYGEILRSG